MHIDKMSNAIKKVYTIDSLGLTSIGLFSICYILFSSPFAELNIQLPFLDFPIFVGEILFFACLVLFAARCTICPLKLHKWHYVLIGYFIFIIVKALRGYALWGPLAMRDAALLYYPMFTVLGYYFYRKDFFIRRNFFITVPFFILVFIKFISDAYVIYWSLSSVLLTAVFIMAYPDKKNRYLLWALLLISIPYTRFFLTSRMMIVSNTLTVFYLVLAFFFIVRFRRSIKIFMGILTIFLFALGILTFSDPVRARTIISFGAILATFHENDKMVQEGIGNFKMAEVKKLELYQPEGKSATYDYKLRLEAFKTRREQAELARISRENLQAQEGGSIDLASSVSATSSEVFVEQGETSVAAEQSMVPQEDVVSIAAQEPQRQTVRPYHFLTGMNNAVFRLFIWRDMLVELAQKKPMLGFDFGKPLRSISLEVLGWGWSNWGGQGWMPAHNSYLNIVYRAGIIGALFLLTIFVVLFNVIREFIRSRSVIGILFYGVLINWFVAANFLMVLELPYTAIPIWSLYGVTLAYCYKKEKPEYELAKQKSFGHRS